MYATITYTVDAGLARLTLNRPDRRNGMTNQMVRETYEAVERAAHDPSVRVLVLSGAGSSFCPGADLGHYSAGEADEPLPLHAFHVTTLLHEMPAVTVAAVNGACAGAGLGWALACDLRVATRAAMFNVAFLDVAVAGDMGGPWLLTRLLGASKARELCFLPGKFSADDAHRIGLVARVFDDAEFHADTESILTRLLRSSPTALRGLKENFTAAETMTLRDFIDFETPRHRDIAGGPHAREAFRAFIEKRPPVFD
jgi:2-(1,2-epoxy-1,2-dihydrophenyl)acetyl-CoA isomerase